MSEKLRLGKQQWHVATRIGHVFWGMPDTIEIHVNLHWFIILQWNKSFSPIISLWLKKDCGIIFVNNSYFIFSDFATQLSFRGLSKWQWSAVKVDGSKDCLIRYRVSSLNSMCGLNRAQMWWTVMQTPGKVSWLFKELHTPVLLMLMEQQKPQILINDLVLYWKV